MFHRKGIESLSGELIEIHDGRVRLAYTTVRGFAALYNWGKLAKISTMSQETCINAWGLLRSGVPAIIHYSASNACSQSRAQRLPLKGSSKGAKLSRMLKPCSIYSEDLLLDKQLPNLPVISISVDFVL
jgi:hypothetical protein